MMGGDKSQHTRKSLKPMLAKSNPDDSKTTSVKADALANKLPTNRRTVDSQPLRYDVE